MPSPATTSYGSNLLYTIIPLGIILGIIVIVLGIRFFPWILWRLRKPTITQTEGPVSIAYELSKDTGEIVALGDAALAEKDVILEESSFKRSTTSSFDQSKAASSLRKFASSLNLSRQRSSDPPCSLHSFRSQDTIIVQLDAQNPKVSTPLLVEINPSTTESSAIITVGNPPNYNNECQ